MKICSKKWKFEARNGTLQGETSNQSQSLRQASLGSTPLETIPLTAGVKMEQTATQETELGWCPTGNKAAKTRTPLPRKMGDNFGANMSWTETLGPQESLRELAGSTRTDTAPVESSLLR